VSLLVINSENVCTQCRLIQWARSPDPLTGFKGHTSKGREDRGGEKRGEKGRGERRNGKGREGPHQLWGQGPQTR